jgi:hypothetical protein
MLNMDTYDTKPCSSKTMNSSVSRVLGLLNLGGAKSCCSCGATLPAFTGCLVAVGLLEMLLHSKRLLLRCACRAAVAAAATAAAAICLLPAQQLLAGCNRFLNSPFIVFDNSELKCLSVLWLQVQQQAVFRAAANLA